MSTRKWVTTNPGEMTDLKVRYLLKNGVALTIREEIEDGRGDTNPLVTLEHYDDEVTMRLQDWGEVLGAFTSLVEKRYGAIAKEA